MSTDENKAVVRRIFAQVINEGNLTAADELIAPSYVYHEPGTPQVHGPGGYKQLISMYRTAFPDLRLTIEDQVAEGDKVVTRWTGRGTHQGDLSGIAPTGKRVTFTGIIISRIVGGKSVEEWENMDALGMQQQLELVPTPGQAG